MRRDPTSPFVTGCVGRVSPFDVTEAEEPKTNKTKRGGRSAAARARREQTIPKYFPGVHNFFKLGQGEDGDYRAAPSAHADDEGYGEQNHPGGGESSCSRESGGRGGDGSTGSIIISDGTANKDDESNNVDARQ